MTDPTEGLYKTITLNDVQLASAYYPIIVELAKHKHCLTYGELVDKAEAAFWLFGVDHLYEIHATTKAAEPVAGKSPQPDTGTNIT